MTDRADKKASEKVRVGRVGDRPYWVLVFSIFVRAAHQVGAAVFLASFLLKGAVMLPHLYIVLAGVSGVILLATESMKHRQFLRELIGVSTFAKLVLLGLAFHGWVPVVPAMLIAFVLASICSHSPKLIRHRLLF